MYQIIKHNAILLLLISSSIVSFFRNNGSFQVSYLEEVTEVHRTRTLPPQEAEEITAKVDRSSRTLLPPAPHHQDQEEANEADDKKVEVVVGSSNSSSSSSGEITEVDRRTLPPQPQEAEADDDKVKVSSSGSSSSSPAVLYDQMDIVVPSSGRDDRVRSFVETLSESIKTYQKSTPNPELTKIRLLVTRYPQDEQKTPQQLRAFQKELMELAQYDQPLHKVQFDIELIHVTDVNFTRGHARNVLHNHSCHEETCLLAAIDVDCEVKSSFFYNATKRDNVEPSKKVYIPKIWGLFNPLGVELIGETDIYRDGYAGGWYFMGYGIYVMSGVDAQNFTYAEFDTWGGEDTKFWYDVKHSKMKVVREKERGVVHKWHTKNCIVGEGLPVDAFPRQIKACYKNQQHWEGTYRRDRGGLAIRKYVEKQRKLARLGKITLAERTAMATKKSWFLEDNKYHEIMAPSDPMSNEVITKADDHEIIAPSDPMSNEVITTKADHETIAPSDPMSNEVITKADDEVSSSSSSSSSYDQMDIVVPSSGRDDRVRSFVETLSESIKIYQQSPNPELTKIRLLVTRYPRDKQKTPQQIEAFQKELMQLAQYEPQKVQFEIELIPVTDVNFTRGHARNVLHNHSCHSSTCLLAAIDVDCEVKSSFFYNATKRDNVEPSKKVYIPKIWGLYNPLGVELIGETDQYHDGYAGSWYWMGYGIYVMSGVDAQNFTYAEFDTWGGEDTKFWYDVRHSNMTVVREKERGVVHKWHTKNCIVGEGLPKDAFPRQINACYKNQQYWEGTYRRDRGGLAIRKYVKKQLKLARLGKITLAERTALATKKTMWFLEDNKYHEIIAPSDPMSNEVFLKKDGQYTRVVSKKT